jgi:hypothetical protein
MRRRALTVPLLLLLLTLFALPLPAALPPARPYTGSGLLLIRNASRQADGSPTPIVFYREPGIGRVAEKRPDRLPLLQKIMAAAPGEYPAAVLGRKGNWLCLAYDEGGHTGWVEKSRRWENIRWREFLPGRTVQLLPGLKKDCTILRREPLSAAGELSPLTPADSFRVEQVRGDWLRVTSAAREGWLRWRDDGGRFLIALPEGQLAPKLAGGMLTR